MHITDLLGDWDEYYRAVGDPDEIAADAAMIPLPHVLPALKDVVGFCVEGGHSEPLASFRFRDELVSVGDVSLTGDRWDALKRTSIRVKAFCGSCNRVTGWVSRGTKERT